MKWFEIQFWQFAKYLLKKGYGYEKESDRTYAGGRSVLDLGRCGSCVASEIQDWIDQHIDLLKL